MIKPEHFYDSKDHLDDKTREAMWKSIQRSPDRSQPLPMVIRDRRSFVFGMAAAVVLGLALYGTWAILRQGFETATPTPLRLERAYVSAIQEFEQVMPTVEKGGRKDPKVFGQITQRQDQLALVDRAISDLRRQTNGSDLSPLVRQRLRQLYSTKLRIMQQMIEEGEIEL